MMLGRSYYWPIYQAAVKYGLPAGPGVFAGVESKAGGRLGDVAFGHSGSFYWVKIANLVGMEGKNAQQYNEALHKHGGPALQAAVDEQASDLMRKYGPRMLRDGIEIPFNAACK